MSGETDLLSFLPFFLLLKRLFGWQFINWSSLSLSLGGEDEGVYFDSNSSSSLPLSAIDSLSADPRCLCGFVNEQRRGENMCTVVQNMMMDIDLSQAKKVSATWGVFLRTCCFFKKGRRTSTGVEGVWEFGSRFLKMTSFLFFYCEEALFFAIYTALHSDSSWLHLLPIKVHLVQPGAQSGVRGTASAILPPLAPSRLFLPSSSQCDSGAIGGAIIGFLFPTFLPCQQLALLVAVDFYPLFGRHHFYHSLCADFSVGERGGEVGYSRKRRRRRRLVLFVQWIMWNLFELPFVIFPAGNFSWIFTAVFTVESAEEKN